MKKRMVAAALMGASLLAVTLASAQAVTQYTQVAKKRAYHGFGITVTRAGDAVRVNGEAVRKQEYSADADVFVHGPYRIVFHKRTGKVRLMKNGTYLGVLKSR